VMTEDISNHSATGLNLGSEVRFKIYKDPIGLGACDITSTDGTAIRVEQALTEEDESDLASTMSTSNNENSKYKVLSDGILVRDENTSTRARLKHEREFDLENTYSGKVLFYNFLKGFGCIAIEDAITFKGVTKQGKIYAMKEDFTQHFVMGLNQSSEVSFRVYKDSMGLGAYDIANADGSALHQRVELIKKDDEAIKTGLES